MNNRTLDRPKALDGLRPSFSAHVRWCEHGAPVECAVARTVHCSFNLPQTSRILVMNNRTLTDQKRWRGFARLFRPTYAGANMGHPSSARWPVLFIAPLSCPAGESQNARDDQGERDASMESGRRMEGDFHPLGGPQAHDLSGRDDRFVEQVAAASGACCSRDVGHPRFVGQERSEKRIRHPGREV